MKFPLLKTNIFPRDEICQKNCKNIFFHFKIYLLYTIISSGDIYQTFCEICMSNLRKLCPRERLQFFFFNKPPVSRIQTCTKPIAQRQRLSEPTTYSPMARNAIKTNITAASAYIFFYLSFANGHSHKAISCINFTFFAFKAFATILHIHNACAAE